MEKAGLDSLVNALKEVADEGELVEPLSEVLSEACAHTSISYDTVISIAKENAQEIMLAAWDLKLLIPRRSGACGEWDYRIPVMRRGEIAVPPSCYFSRSNKCSM
ncbi:MAG: hypothetical protein K9J85_07115 [Desulfobacteraceae bacterium]|nr:hypothetical protein [Desulfobacteraceae bacterium]